MVAQKVCVLVSIVVDTSRKSSQVWVIGNHALKTLSLMLKISRLHWILEIGIDSSHVRSTTVSIIPLISVGRASCGSASIPMLLIKVTWVATEAQKSAECVMLPIVPSGQTGSREGPRKIGNLSKPRAAMHDRAHVRPAVNSRIRSSLQRSCKKVASSGSKEP